jgi:hypothetical protein
MVRTLATDLGVSWHYNVATPNLAAKAEELDFYSLYPQLAVAIDGAIRDCPRRRRRCEWSHAPRSCAGEEKDALFPRNVFGAMIGPIGAAARRACRSA